MMLARPCLVAVVVQESVTPQQSRQPLQRQIVREGVGLAATRAPRFLSLVKRTCLRSISRRRNEE